MERNENDIFDELVRGKLANYTEAPEPEWIRSIQAKKSRAVNLYQLYRLMLIAIIVGAGIFAGIQLMPYQFETNTSASQNSPEQQDAVQTFPSYSNTTQQAAEFASANGGTTVRSTSTSTPASAVSNKSLLNFSERIQSTTVKSNINKQSDHKTATEHKSSLLNNENKEEKNTKDILTPATEDKNKQPEVDKKDKTQASTLPCKAIFDYYTSYSGEFKFIHLAELNADARLSWDFGDGATSEQEAASHSFKHTGTYEVTLTITDKENSCTFSNAIVYVNPNEKTTPIIISGKVIAGSSSLKNAPVELFKFDEQKGKFKSVQTLRTNQLGEYTTTLERNTRYIIKGYPTTDAQYYSATYWGNAAESENATEIFVMPSENDELLGYTIQLIKDEQQADITPITPPTGNPNEFQQVFLMNANNEIVSVGTVDSKGNFTFDPGIDAGDYTVLNPSNGASTPTTVPPNAGGIAGKNPALGSLPAPASGQVTVFPNPASSVINFGLNSDKNEIATLVIMDASGVERTRKSIVFNAGFNTSQYDISDFAPGVYYLMIYRNNKQVSSSRIVKLGDTKE